MIGIAWDITRWILGVGLALIFFRDAKRLLHRWRRLAYPDNGVPRSTLVKAMRAVQWSVGAAAISSGGALLFLWFGSPPNAALANTCLGAYLVSLVSAMIACVVLVHRIRREESRQRLDLFNP